MKQSYMYFKYFCEVFLQSIIVFLSLGYDVSVAGVENTKSIFSEELDIIRPWEECKELNETHSLC